MSWSIVNIVATGDLKQRVDLIDIANLPHTIYDYEIYGGRVAYLKTPEMKGKVTIFPSGKLISIGTKTQTDSQFDLEHTVKMLSESELIKPVKVNAIIRNIVVLHQLILSGLEEIADSLGGIYEPDKFPGIIYKPKEIGCTYLIFNSGKVIISGIKSFEMIKTSVEYIESLIKDIML